ncbi:MAG: hypothetical protein K8R79_05220 [Calditrichales bacterium]|nr:hypothetical protein [Calditrichales bacterium]
MVDYNHNVKQGITAVKSDGFIRSVFGFYLFGYAFTFSDFTGRIKPQLSSSRSSNHKKLVVGIPYYLKLFYYLLIIILGYSVFGYFIYLEFIK